jgi:DNA-binding transcriptional ArsR family regulator
MADVQATIDALASPIRREILWMVWNEERAVGDISGPFEVAAPTISGHLAALRRADLVTMRVDGNFRRYRANRDAVAAVIPLLRHDDDRWRYLRRLDEQQLAKTAAEQLVRVSVDLEVDPETAFDAFTRADRFSRWLGVPVRLGPEGFACTLEWGTRVRGHYEVVVRPELIALRWDFDDDSVPVPGRQLVAYVRFAPLRRRTRVEVHQHASDAAQAEFLAAAWSMVLGRLKVHHS